MATLHRRHAIDPEERGSVKTARVFSPSPSTPLHFHPYIRSPWDTCFLKNLFAGHQKKRVRRCKLWKPTKHLVVRFSVGDGEDDTDRGQG
ncbi:Chitin synthase 1 [Fusarium oxysporum f. sp. albedinis]|nr:Chitin synthase 1 [Fusarium oxysporum f. sp. albedinis]